MTTLLARMVVLGLALVSSILLARLLGPEGRGLFALVLLLPELARTFGLLGIEQANAVYAGLQPDGRRALVWHSAALATIVGGALAITTMCYVAFGAPGLPELARGPMVLYAIALSTVPVGLAVEYWRSIMRGMNRILTLNLVEMGAKLISLLILVMFLVWLDLGVLGAVLTDLILNFGTLALVLALLRHMGILGKPSVDWSLAKRTARFAFPAYCAVVLLYLNYRVDQFIIAILLPTEQLGFYVIAVALGEQLWILTGAVANALLPHLTNSKDRDPALCAIIARHVLVWTGAGCCLVFFLADILIRITYSSAFAEAVAPLRWLLPGIFMGSAGKVLVAELLAREKVRCIVWMAAITAIVNVTGSLVLIPYMGISGAALASTLSYTLLSFMMAWFYLRETHLSWLLLIPGWSDLLTYSNIWSRWRTVFLGKHQIARGVQS